MGQQDQEAWFVRIGRSHTPCHWKGWAALLLVLAWTAATIAILSWLAPQNGGLVWEAVPALPIFAALFAMDRIADGRSKPWRS